MVMTPMLGLAGIAIDYSAAARSKDRLELKFLRSRLPLQCGVRPPPYIDTAAWSDMMSKKQNNQREGWRMNRRGLAIRLSAAVGAAFTGQGRGSAQAQTSDEDFYRKQTISILSYSPGVSELYARLLARHIGRFIPGAPHVIVQGMPGAGGLKAIDYLYNIAPKDGSVICTIGSGLPFEPMLGRSDLKFDPLKLTWLGSMSRSVSVALSWHNARVKTFEDLLAHELIIPGTGVGADTQIVPTAIGHLTGARFKLIPGYPNILEAALAMEKGEVEGMGYWTLGSIRSAHPDWLAQKKVNVLFHTGMEPLADLPDIPMIRTKARNEVDAQALEFLLAREVIGRPFAAPPSIPASRAKVLREAFMATLRDAEFLKEAEKGQFDISPVSAAEAEALLRKASAASPEVIRRVLGSP